MIVPIVNINGTTQSELFEVMSKATPHGRDFQVNKPGDYALARDEHHKLMFKVSEVRDHFEKLVLAISAQ